MDREASIGERLERYRIGRRYSQAELARRSGLSAPTISRWMRARSLEQESRPGLLRVAAALGLSRVETNGLLSAAGLPLLQEDEPAPTGQAFPSPRWAAAGPAALPSELTSFVGREQESFRLAELLDRDDVRLVTLTGLGGVGKTRLAVRAARMVLDRFPGGVFFVRLAAVAESSLVIPAVADAVGLRDVPADDVRGRLVRWLARRGRVLLVLDNLEHLTASGPDLVALLEASQGLTLLVTSQKRLAVSAEYLHEVLPFPLPNSPTSKELRANPGVALFLTRARAANARDELELADLRDAADIVRRLDGLPLAIELAAARTTGRYFSEVRRDFVSGLELAAAGPADVEDRHRGLRNAIAFTVRLLTPAARSFLSRLSVFAGGWTAEAAAAVCAEPGTPPETVDLLLHELLGVGLIQEEELEADEVRYGMPETIREYGQERLLAGGELAALRERHARYFLALAESAPPYLPQVHLPPWYQRVGLERDNLRAALRWAEGTGDGALLGRLAAALWPYWHETMRVDEGRNWLEPALAHQASLPQATRAMLLTGAAMMASNQTEYTVARARAEEALARWAALGDDHGQALVCQQLGWVAFGTGDAEATCAWFERALASWRRVDDPLGVGIALCDLAFSSYSARDFERALPYLDEAAGVLIPTGDPMALARLATEQGLLELLQGRPAIALAPLAEAVERYRAGQSVVYPSALFYLATAECFVGDIDRAAAQYLQVLALREETGDRLGLALVLLGFAAVAQRRGDGERAAVLCGASFALQQRSRLRLAPAIAEVYEAEVRQVTEQIGAATFAEQFNLGQELTVEEAIALARELVAPLSEER